MESHWKIKKKKTDLNVSLSVKKRVEPCLILILCHIVEWSNLTIREQWFQAQFEISQTHQSQRKSQRPQLMMQSNYTVPEGDRVASLIFTFMSPSRKATQLGMHTCARRAHQSDGAHIWITECCHWKILITMSVYIAIKHFSQPYTVK